MLSFLIKTTSNTKTHENNSHLTPVPVVKEWLDYYNHFGVHGVHMQTLHNRWRVQLGLLQIMLPFSSEKISHAQTWYQFYKWLAAELQLLQVIHSNCIHNTLLVSPDIKIHCIHIRWFCMPCCRSTSIYLHHGYFLFQYSLTVKLEWHDTSSCMNHTHLPAKHVMHVQF
jgi:hypothetical protein